ncbi:alpha/beta fold hydrolase [Streptacidiphilus pinicola]|nr:alpha/beta hydrolase [Streptacidiphilus pinicola]
MPSADWSHSTARDARAAHYAEGAFDPEATRAAFAGLEIPVLILAGELDFSPSPVLATQLSELFADGWVQLVVQPGAGHFPWLDDAAWFGGVVTRWLAERTSPPADPGPLPSYPSSSSGGLTPSNACSLQRPSRWWSQSLKKVPVPWARLLVATGLSFLRVRC